MIALRLNFTDVVRDDSLKHIVAKGKRVGCQFDVRLSYYRGHFLSAIDEIGVKIDGEEIPEQDITIALKGQEYSVAQLPTLGNVFWPIAENATIRVFKDGGISEGEHDIDFKLFFRSPYMEIGPDMYMPNDGCGYKRLRIS